MYRDICIRVHHHLERSGKYGIWMEIIVLSIYVSLIRLIKSISADHYYFWGGNV